MYAYANQTLKRTHYAQAWSDAIENWQSAATPKRLVDNELELYQVPQYQAPQYEVPQLKIDQPPNLPQLDLNPPLNRDLLWPEGRFDDYQ